MNTLSRQPSYRALVVFLLIALAVSVVGGLITATSVDTWYPTLRKPVFTPPDAVFAPVWTVLFILIAVAGWRVWEKRAARGVRLPMAVYAIQLGLNLGWSGLFFGLRRPDLATVEIMLLLAVIAWNVVVFRPIDRVAAVLLIPYLVWVAFAALLTTGIWLLNSGTGPGA